METITTKLIHLLSNLFLRSEGISYMGNDPEVYEDATWSYCGQKIFIYTQVLGNRNMSNFIPLAHYGDISSSRYN